MRPPCVSVCVCLCVFCRRVIGGVVALLPAAADERMSDRCGYVRPPCVSVCVCLCVFCRRVIGGVVALLPAAADAAPGHRPTALAHRLLCLVNLGRAHCRHTATHGGTLGLPTHTAPSLVSHLLDAAHCYRQWRNYNFWAPRQTFATGPSPPLNL